MVIAVALFKYPKREELENAMNEFLTKIDMTAGMTPIKIDAQLVFTPRLEEWWMGMISYRDKNR